SLTSSLKDRKAVAGLIVRLPWNGWHSSFDFTNERTELENGSPAAGISAAGQTAVTSGALDVLRDTNINPPDFGQYALSGEVISPIKTTLNDAILRIGGPTLRLAGGNVDLSVQFEKAVQRLGDYSDKLTWL